MPLLGQRIDLLYTQYLVVVIVTLVLSSCEGSLVRWNLVAMISLAVTIAKTNQPAIEWIDGWWVDQLSTVSRLSRDSILRALPLNLPFPQISLRLHFPLYFLGEIWYSIRVDKVGDNATSLSPLKDDLRAGPASPALTYPSCTHYVTYIYTNVTCRYANVTTLRSRAYWCSRTKGLSRNTNIPPN